MFVLSLSSTYIPWKLPSLALTAHSYISPLNHAKRNKHSMHSGMQGYLKDHIGELQSIQWQNHIKLQTIYRLDCWSQYNKWKYKIWPLCVNLKSWTPSQKRQMAMGYSNPYPSLPLRRIDLPSRSYHSDKGDPNLHPIPRSALWSPSKINNNIFGQKTTPKCPTQWDTGRIVIYEVGGVTVCRPVREQCTEIN